jgi:peptidoglycan hydrolase-like protein with peptidoglycan-binding domain
MIRFRTEHQRTTERQRTRQRRTAVIATVGAAAALAATLATPGVSFAATDVQTAQTDLNGLNYNVGLVDGVVGPKTQAATSAFQSDRCLTVDAAIGSQTLAELTAVVQLVQTKAGMASPDGIYSSATASAVKSYQSAHGLSADGIAGADTMASMGIPRIVASCRPAGATQGETIVNIAKAEVGTRAASDCVPGKGYNICADWCAAFATWVWRYAGVSIPFETYVPTVYDWAVSHDKWYGTSQLNLAQPGYLIIFGSANNRYHIGVVDHVSGSTVYVISGNTQNSSGVWGAWDKAYPLSSSTFYGLVHL